MSNRLRLSHHADERAQQRGIRDDQITLALHYGVRQAVYAGRDSYTLTDRAIAETWPWYSEPSRLRGVCIIVQDDVVITVYHARSVASRPGLRRRARLVEQLRQREEREMLRSFDC